MSDPLTRAVDFGRRHPGGNGGAGRAPIAFAGRGPAPLFQSGPAPL
jgi:hypothetical protein